ncbi:hypothetical protein EV424DRAFT_1418768 [Suillus variegatus]|nr:hypothetical protein EV424DRAFT_1418768 [Suillus variegatus]
MRGLGTDQRRYIMLLNRCMDHNRPSRLRLTALRAVCEAGQELASITSASMPQGVDVQLLDTLSRALSSVVPLNDDQTNDDIRPHATFHSYRDSCYIRLIYALTKDHGWYQRLDRDCHLDRCISLANRTGYSLDVQFYLVAILGRINSLGNELPFGPSQEWWRRLIAQTWEYVKSPRGCDYIDEIPALVTVTRLHLSDSDHSVPREWFSGLAVNLTLIWFKWRKSQADYVKLGIAQASIDAALFHMDDLQYELRRMVNQRNTTTSRTFCRKFAKAVAISCKEFTCH